MKPFIGEDFPKIFNASDTTGYYILNRTAARMIAGDSLESVMGRTLNLDFGYPGLIFPGKILGVTEDKIASNAEVFENEVIADLFDLFFLGQIWRVAESICIKGGAPKICQLMQRADIEIKSLGKSIQERGIFYQLPIQNSVKLQLGSILIIADALKKLIIK